MADLLTAALGGIVVFLLTTAARAAGIPGDVRTHDAAIRERDSRLGTWVADRDYALGLECTALRSSLGQQPTEQEDRFGNRPAEAWNHEAHKIDEEIAAARALALHEYRDQERMAKIDLAQELAGEGWPHRVYRKLRGRGVPPLKSPDSATPVLDAWRKQSSMSGERPVWPVDATQRTLEDAIANVRVLGP